MILFNGKEFALNKERVLSNQLKALSEIHHQRPQIGCILFTEDEGGVIYTQEKKAVAQRLGIEYIVREISISLPVDEILQAIVDFNNNPQITGIIIQKPWKNTWLSHFQTRENSAKEFESWWLALTQQISLTKDVDGLHPQTHAYIQQGIWTTYHQVLPATCRAVLSILDYAQKELARDITQEKTLIVGRSQLLGLPLSHMLKHTGWNQVNLVGQDGFRALRESNSVADFPVIISSTGRKNLITGEDLADECVIIDAGFPTADVEFETAQHKAAFLTPVPNGVGPVTVISLLENAVDLCYNL